jgi:hypothetical protein
VQQCVVAANPDQHRRELVSLARNSFEWLPRPRRIDHNTTARDRYYCNLCFQANMSTLPQPKIREQEEDWALLTEYSVRFR